MSRILFIIILLFSNFVRAQTFTLDTIQYKGDPNKYINLVIFGDGYTDVQLDTFLLNAKSLSTYLFTQQPFSNYINYYNVFAVKVASLETGIKHPNTASDCQGQSSSFPISNPNNYFGTTFDYAGIHRLVVPVKGYNAVNILSTLLPQYDQIFFVANSPFYGGSGGTYATSSIHSSSGEVTVHELGHSFAGLADEYYAGDGYARETYNMTKTTDTNKVKWVNWYGDFGVGIYQHCCGGNSDQWYKPSQNCKMQSLNRLFCPVCRETIVAEIDRRTNAIVRYLPVESQIAINTDSLSFQLIELMKPAPNTLKITWELNGQPLSTQNEISNIPKNQFKNGLNTVSVKVVDTSNYLRIDNYSNLNHSIIQWDVTKTVTGFELVDDQYEFQTTLYPNPISSVGSLRVCSKKPFKLKSIDVVALSGAMVISNVVNKTFTTCGEEQINLSGQPAGNYYMVLNVDKHRISIPFMIKN